MEDRDNYFDPDLPTAVVNDITVSDKPVYCNSTFCTGECWVHVISKQQDDYGKHINQLLRQSAVNGLASCRKIKNEIWNFDDCSVLLDDNNCMVKTLFEGQTGSISTFSLADSGSQVCCLGEKQALEAGVTKDLLLKPDLNLKGVSGSALKCLGSHEFTLHLAKQIRKIRFYIVAADVNIIGTNCLKDFRATIDFGTGTIRARPPLQHTNEIITEPIGITPPQVYLLSHRRGNTDDRLWNYTLHSDCNEDLLEKYRWREIIVFACDCDDPKADELCSCVFQTTGMYYIKQDGITIDTHRTPTPISDTTILKAYLAETAYDTSDTSVNLIDGVPASTLLTNEGEMICEPPHIEANFDLEFTPGDPIDMKELQKNNVCLQCEVTDDRLHLCNLTNPDCIRRLNIQQVAHPDTVQWSAVRMSNRENSRADSNITILNDKDFQELDAEYLIADSGNDSIKILPGDIDQLYIKSDDRMKLLLNIVRCINYLKGTEHNMVAIYGWKDKELHIDDFTELFTCIAIDLMLVTKAITTNYTNKMGKKTPLPNALPSGMPILEKDKDKQNLLRYLTTEFTRRIQKTCKRTEGTSDATPSEEKSTSENSILLDYENPIELIDDQSSSDINTEPMEKGFVKRILKDYPEVYPGPRFDYSGLTKSVDNINSQPKPTPIESADVFTVLDSHLKSKGHVSSEEGQLLDRLSYSGPPEYRKRMEEIILNRDRCQGHMKSLWAKGGLDIGVFRSREPPHKEMLLNFPFKPGNYAWRPEKPRLCPETLLESATEHLDQLEKAGVLENKYSYAQAPCRWIEKKGIEMTKDQWVKQGHDPKDFVAGVAGKQGGGLRIVSDLHQCSSRVEATPYYQLSTKEQIGRISTGVKYISVIDLTSAFFHLKLGEKSSMACGINPGVRDKGLYVYKRCPMGHATSASALCNAIQSILGGTDKLLQYSDNILLLSETIEDALELADWCTAILQICGWKARLTKCVFCWNKKIRIFGHELDLEEGTLRPNLEKLSALAATKTIETKLQLQKYLGGYRWNQNLIPPMSDSIAILGESLSGTGPFQWTPRQQEALEKMNEVLSNHKCIMIYLPSPNLPIYGVCDSSEHTSSGVAYQIQKLDGVVHGPFPLNYMQKAWNSHPEFKSIHSSAKKELMGLLWYTRYFNDQYPSHPKERIICTDAIVCGLLNYGAKYNNVLGNDRLFLSQLENLQIVWTKNTDLAMRVADFYTRDSESSPKDKPKKKTLKDIDEKFVESRIKKWKNLFVGPQPASLVNYDISFLFELSDDEVDQVDDESIVIDRENHKATATINGTPFELTVKEVPATHNRHVEPHSGGIKASMKGILDVHRIAKETLIETDDGKIKRIVATSLAREADVNQVSETPVGGIDFDAILREEPSVDPFVSLDHWNERDAELILQKARSEFPNMASDILSLLCPMVSPEIVNPHRNYVVRNPKTNFHHWWNFFLKNSNLLDIPLFNKLTKNCPVWKEIYKSCEEDKQYVTPHGVFKLYKGVLIWENKKSRNPSCQWKVVLSSYMSGEMTTFLHNSFGHPGPAKLQAMLSSRFLINNLKRITELVYHFCKLCPKCRPKYHGQVIVPRPKFTQVIRTPGFCFYADELHVQTGQKMLLFTDVYSHYTIAAVLKKQLTSDYFLEILDQFIIKPFGYPHFLITDGDKKISSQQVKYSCSVMGIQHVTTVRYRPTSMLVELYNQVFLRCIRFLYQTERTPPQSVGKLVTRVCHIINTSPFLRCKEISPYSLFHPTKQPNFPPVGLTMEKVKLTLDNPSKDLEDSISLANYLHKWRNQMLAARRYLDNNPVHTNVHDQMTVGSRVLIKNFPKVNKKGRLYKLMTLYEGDYTIRDRVGSTLWVSPSVPFNTDGNTPVVPIIRTHVHDAVPAVAVMDFPDNPSEHGKAMLKFYAGNTIPEGRVIKYNEDGEAELVTWAEYHRDLELEEEMEREKEFTNVENEETDKDETDITDYDLLTEIGVNEDLTEVPEAVAPTFVRHYDQFGRTGKINQVNRVKIKSKQKSVRFEPQAEWKKYKEDTPTIELFSKNVNLVRFAPVATKIRIRCARDNYGGNHRPERVLIHDNITTVARDFTNSKGIKISCCCKPCRAGSNRCFYYSCDGCISVSRKQHAYMPDDEYD